MKERLTTGDYEEREGGLFKLIHYIGYSTKNHMTAEFGSIKTEYEPVTHFYVSPGFFQGDHCYSTGRCCKSFTTTYTQEGYDRLQAIKKEDYDKYDLDYSAHQTLLDRLEKVEVDINGNNIPFWAVFQGSEPNTDEATKHLFKTKRCDFLIQKGDKFVCSVHPAKGLTCALPHINFFHTLNTGKTYIRKQQYGRNWLLGCPVQFSEFNYDAYKTWDLKWLKIAADVAKDMKVETYLPELLEYLDSIDYKLRMGITPQKPVDIAREFRFTKVKQRRLV